MSRDNLLGAVAVSAICLFGYLLGAYMVALDNSMTLNDSCVKSGHTWIASPLTLGATGECK